MCTQDEWAQHADGDRTVRNPEAGQTREPRERRRCSSTRRASRAVVHGASTPPRACHQRGSSRQMCQAVAAAGSIPEASSPTRQAVVPATAWLPHLQYSISMSISTQIYRAKPAASPGVLESQGQGMLRSKRLALCGARTLHSVVDTRHSTTTTQAPSAHDSPVFPFMFGFVNLHPKIARPPSRLGIAPVSGALGSPWSGSSFATSTTTTRDSHSCQIPRPRRRRRCWLILVCLGSRCHRSAPVARPPSVLSDADPPSRPPPSSVSCSASLWNTQRQTGWPRTQRWLFLSARRDHSSCRSRRSFD